MYDQKGTPDPKTLLEYNGVCDKPVNYKTPVTGMAENKGVIVAGSYTGDMYKERTKTKIGKLGPVTLTSRSY